MGKLLPGRPLSEPSEYMDKIKADELEVRGIWRNLCYNENAVCIVEQYHKGIRGRYLTANKHLHDMLIELCPEKIVWYIFCEITERVDFIEQNIEKVNWKTLSKNPHAIEILKKNPDRIWWDSLCENPAAIDMIRQHKNLIYWDMLSINPAAIDLLEQNSGFIDWKLLTLNPAIWSHSGRLLDVNKLDWIILSKNPMAVYLMEQYPERICWHTATQNPGAVDLLRRNLDKVEWRYLALNESKEAVELMEENMTEQNQWNNDLIFCNKHIFEYDYEYIKSRCEIYNEELMQVCWHPRRVQRMLEEDDEA